MKVLFAVHDEKASLSIVKKYQKEYKEIISYKNVYYFNAILRELQRNKTYDRIIIDEDLEEFTSTSYEENDKFIFNIFDRITDEASNSKGNDIPIIIICSERRTKSEEFLVKLFGLGIYNAIIGNDRSTDEVCKLLNQPRTKKEAKVYYKIDSNVVDYDPEGENDVSEEEMQYILSYFKKLGNNKERYVEAFGKILSQYNEEQMKVIISILPLGVKSVLEESSIEYQKLAAINNKSIARSSYNKDKTAPTSEKLLTTEEKTNNKQKIIVPTNLDNNLIKKIAIKRPTIKQPIIEEDEYEDEEDYEDNDFQDVPEVENLPKEVEEIPEAEDIEEIIPETPKRGRGRPKKIKTAEEILAEEAPKRGRGRPKKIVEAVKEIEEFEEPEEIEPILPEVEEVEDFVPYNKIQNQDNINDDFEDRFSSLPGFEDEEEEEKEEIAEEQTDTISDDSFSMLPGMEDEEQEQEDNNFEDDDYSNFDYEKYENNKKQDATIDDFFNEEDENTFKIPTPVAEIEDSNKEQIEEQTEDFAPKGIQNYRNSYDSYDDSDYNSLLSSNKKVIAFVGTSKNGTSFIVNNMAKILSDNGINTAILDLTQNKNSYYIYNNNDDYLRSAAETSIDNLIQGLPGGMQISQNLFVYVDVPGQDDSNINNVGPILENLIKNHSVVLLDCDFSTPLSYFEKAQEIYLVQSMDVLTIQPLTVFLKELKNKDILNQNKLRIIINKEMRLKGITAKQIVGGMSKYNNPEMSIMTDLFDRNTIVPIEIPFDLDVYARYIEGLAECNITVNKYPKEFQIILNKLASIIYPLLPAKNSKEKHKKGYQYSNGFSDSVNKTLNNMKKNY